jgi:predicted transcriptional regulator of viral defense system
MLKNITELGPREAEFIALFASGNNKFFTNKDATDFWQSKEIAKKKLSLLEKKGWIARIERGKYLVIPLEAGPQRSWSENPLIIAGNLAEPACVAYWSAIRYWNWTEQLPQITYVQTTQRKNSRQKSIFGIRFEIVTVPGKKYFGMVKQWEGSNSFYVTDKEKTLIDCADDVKRSGGIEELTKSVKQASGEVDFVKMDKYARKINNGAIQKRLGFLFDELGTELSGEAINVLKRWRNELSHGISPLLPGGSEQGTIITKWHLRVNAEI